MTDSSNPLKTGEFDTISGHENIQVQNDLEEKQPGSNQAKTGEFDSFSNNIERVRIYIYTELLEQGIGNKKVKNVVKVGKVLKSFNPESHHFERIQRDVYDKAVKIAFKEIYRLKDAKIPFKRVFISNFGDIDSAKKDPESLEYFAK